MTVAATPIGQVHIIGAGLAGLATALSLSAAGRQVVIHEAAPQAGGRCRSYFDPVLGRRIDNGNHLLLSVNRAALAYLAEIGAGDSLNAGGGPIPFLDLASGRSWSLALGDGGFLRRLSGPLRQVPGARLRDGIGMLRLAAAGPRTTVAQAVGQGALMERFWHPLTAAVLNAHPDEASAALLRSVLRTAMVEGGDGLVPLTAKIGLSESFVDPALATLAARGAEIRFGRRLRGIDRDDRRATTLRFHDDSVTLENADAVVVAAGPSVATGLLPGLSVPMETSSIVNAHFLLDAPGRLPGGEALVGLIGGTAEWVFLRDTIASVTVSAADTLLERSAEELLNILWRDTAAALGRPKAPRPPGRIVKEKRATFRQTPKAARRRPPQRTALRNLFLAGDWTDTGLPATIEGAIRSGRAAADIVLTHGAD